MPSRSRQNARIRSGERSPTIDGTTKKQARAPWSSRISAARRQFANPSSKLNATAGAHGVGRVDLVENRRVGMKSRGLYETPGGTVIVEALRALEELVLDRETRHYREHLGLTFAELVYDGRWFTALRDNLDACIDSILEYTTGDVRVRLFKGNATVTGRRSPYSLYDFGLATYSSSDKFDHTAAVGFIDIYSLPARTQARSQTHRDAR